MNTSREDWLSKTGDTLLANMIAFKTPIDMSLYSLVFKQYCHLPMELEDSGFWALKKLNINLEGVGEHISHNITRLMNLDRHLIRVHKYIIR